MAVNKHRGEKEAKRRQAWCKRVARLDEIATQRNSEHSKTRKQKGRWVVGVTDSNMAYSRPCLVFVPEK